MQGKQPLFFLLVYLLPKFSFSFTVALGVKAEKLHRKLYGYDIMLWTETSVLFLC